MKTIDAFSTEMKNYFKDKIVHIGDSDKKEDILEYNSDLHKILPCEPFRTGKVARESARSMSVYYWRE